MKDHILKQNFAALTRAYNRLDDIDHSIEELQKLVSKLNHESIAWRAELNEQYRELEKLREA